MQRSGSQKVLLVISIINIVFAVIALLGGLAMMFGGAVVGAADPAEVESALAGSGLSRSDLGLFAGLGGLIIILSGVIQLILGILGVRAANDNQKIMPVWILAIIELILSIVSLVSIISSGSFSSQNWSAIVSLALAVLVMWIANNIKREAGK